MDSMAGNALPLVLLAGAALFMMKKKGDGASAGGIPEDQGKSATTGNGNGAGNGNGNGNGNGAGNGNGNGNGNGEIDPATEEEAFRVDWTFDPTANMPWVETLEDYQAWNAKLDADEENVWTGALEFRDMDEHHADLGAFIENEMGQYGQTIGRTIDRPELDPAAKEAMEASDNAIVEKGIVKLFEDPGLDFLLVFVNDALPPKMKMSILFVFDSDQSQGASMSKVADFKAKWATVGVQVATQVGYIGMQYPSSLKSTIKAFLNANLPKKVAIGGLPPSIDASSNP